MGKFMILYTGGGIPESKEEQDIVMGAWHVWYGGLGDALLDGGNPFSTAKSIDGTGEINDNSISSPPITGYTIITADSLDDAMTKVKSHPHLNYDGQISVHETIPM